MTNEGRLTASYFPCSVQTEAAPALLRVRSPFQKVYSGYTANPNPAALDMCLRAAFVADSHTGVTPGFIQDPRDHVPRPAG